jgi:hypothetical protein
LSVLFRLGAWKLQRINVVFVIFTTTMVLSRTGIKILVDGLLRTAASMKRKNIGEVSPANLDDLRSGEKSPPSKSKLPKARESLS